MNTLCRAILIRCIRTICQTAVALISTNAVLLSDVDWIMVISGSLLAGILSVLTSIATGLPEVEFEKHLQMYVDEPSDSEEADNDKRD